MVLPDEMRDSFFGLLGMDFASDAGEFAVSVDLGPQHMNPNGLAHGGVAYSLIDTAMGAATMTVVPDGGRCATLEIHVRYHHGARSGRLTATAELVSHTKTVAQMAATVVDQDDRLIASATGSFTITPPRD